MPNHGIISPHNILTISFDSKNFRYKRELLNQVFLGSAYSVAESLISSIERVNKGFEGLKSSSRLTCLQIILNIVMLALAIAAFVFGLKSRQTFSFYIGALILVKMIPVNMYLIKVKKGRFVKELNQIHERSNAEIIRANASLVNHGFKAYYRAHMSDPTSFQQATFSFKTTTSEANFCVDFMKDLTFQMRNQMGLANDLPIGGNPFGNPAGMLYQPQQAPFSNTAAQRPPAYEFSINNAGVGPGGLNNFSAGNPVVWSQNNQSNAIANGGISGNNAYQPANGMNDGGLNAIIGAGNNQTIGNYNSNTYMYK